MQKRAMQKREDGAASPMSAFDALRSSQLLNRLISAPNSGALLMASRQLQVAISCRR